MASKSQHSFNPFARPFEPSTAGPSEFCQNPLHTYNDDWKIPTGSKTVRTTHTDGVFRYWCSQECASEAKEYGKFRRKYAESCQQGRPLRSQDRSFLHNRKTGRKVWDRDISEGFKYIVDTMISIEVIEEPAQIAQRDCRETFSVSTAQASSLLASGQQHESTAQLSGSERGTIPHIVLLHTPTLSCAAKTPPTLESSAAPSMSHEADFGEDIRHVIDYIEDLFQPEASEIV